MYINLISFSVILLTILIIHPYYKKHEEFKDGSIPKTIIQTYYDLNKIPKKVYDNIKLYAPNYKHIIYDDKQCILFLKKYFKHEVVEKFINLKIGAHKADLFRYCYLYINGGVYLDIKTVLIKPIEDIFNKNYFYTVIDNSRKQIFQGIIACQAKNPIFLDLIGHIVRLKSPKYTAFIRYMYICLSLKTKNKLVQGLNKINNKEYLYLFQENCTSDKKNKLYTKCLDGKDRYGLCCYIYDNNEPIIKTRYPDFPW